MFNQDNITSKNPKNKILYLFVIVHSTLKPLKPINSVFCFPLFCQVCHLSAYLNPLGLLSYKTK